MLTAAEVRQLRVVLARWPIGELRRLAVLRAAGRGREVVVALLCAALLDAVPCDADGFPLDALQPPRGRLPLDRSPPPQEWRQLGARLGAGAAGLPTRPNPA